MNDLGLLIKKISNRLESGRNRSLKELGLTGTQLDLLQYLYYHREQENTLSHIATFFGIQHTSVIHVLKILEEKGYIYKEPTMRNPRFKNICLTEKSLSIMEKINTTISHVHSRMLSGVSETEEAELIRLLLQVYGNLKEMDSGNKNNSKGRSDTQEKTPPQEIH